MPTQITPTLGMHFIVGLSGIALNQSDRDVLRQLKPAGVILRAHNFAADKPYPEWLATLSKLIAEVRECSGRDNPIVAIDHEGGRVHRTPAPLTQFPSAMRHRSFAEEVATAMAEELRSIGVNFSFAPVADVHSNAANPVIGERAYSTDPNEAAEAACIVAKTLLKNGIVPVGKHFPGHGDTLQDSHEELPYLNLTIEQMRQRELVPFRALIKAGIPCILTAHIIFRSIDLKAPATLSSLVLQNILRKELGFEGVIISDDLDMKAIADNYSDDAIATAALTAGLDILLFNHQPERAIQVASVMHNNIAKDKALRKSFEASTERVSSLLQKKLARYQPTALSEKVFQAHQQLAQKIQNL